MADDTNTDKQKPADPKYSVDELADEGYLAPHPPFVVRGALSGERRENFTVEQAKPIVDKWLKREITVEQAQPEPDADEEE